MKLRPGRRRDAAREDRDLRRPHDAVENRLVHQLHGRRAPENRACRSAAWKHTQREGSYRRRCRRPDLPQAPRTELFCGLRARRSAQDRQLTQLGISKYWFFRAAEDLSSVYFFRRATTALTDRAQPDGNE